MICDPSSRKTLTTSCSWKGSHVPSRKRGPRRTVRASFPAYSSSTALSAILTPVLPLQRKPFANVTSLIRLMLRRRALNRSQTGHSQAALR